MLFGCIEVVMMILFATLAEYDMLLEADIPTYLSDGYRGYMDIHVMIFIGFGFLMTFLKRWVSSGLT